MKDKTGYRNDKLIIFTRYPVPGKTKTRLIPHLGPFGAADLQRRLTERILKTARKAASFSTISIEVHFEGGSMNRMEQWLGPGLDFVHQHKGDIGDRMFQSFKYVFEKGCGKAVLAGADIPGLNSSHIRDAFISLDDNDAVIGPGTDGGYWLIGLKRPVDIFSSINWSTSEVLGQTIAVSLKKKLKVHLLGTLSDIDSIDDLNEWSEEESRKRPYISVIIPALNEEKSIDASIQSSLHQDAEIIVADGGSDDATVRKASEAGAMVLNGPRGRAVQMNHGAGHANGRVFLFLHADTLLPDGYVNTVFETLMPMKTIAGAFLFKTGMEQRLMKVFEFNANFRSRHFHLPYGDQGIFLRRPVFEAEGGFPETAIAEDLLFIRALAKKGKIRIAPSYAVTSGRRWKKYGIIRTMIINQVIMTGCLMGISPDRLALLYRIKKNSSSI